MPRSIAPLLIFVYFGPLEGHRDASHVLLAVEQGEPKDGDESEVAWSETVALSTLEDWLRKQSTDRCARWGAQTNSNGMCMCDPLDPFAKPTRQCGSIDKRFEPRAECRDKAEVLGDCILFSADCRCLRQKAQNFYQVPDSAQALRNPAVAFCARLMGDLMWKHHIFSEDGEINHDDALAFLKVPKDMRKMLEATSATPLCEAALKGYEDAALAAEALESKKGPEPDRLSDGPGHRLENLMKMSEHTAHAFRQVCRDECKDLISEMQDQAGHVAIQVGYAEVSLSEMCALSVVKRVESKLTSCCADACGWDGGVCIRWPFLDPTEQDDWLSQCCAEAAIFRGSERERVCNSVNPTLRKQLMEGDPPPGFQGTPMEVGQDQTLVWTLEGADSKLGHLAFAEDGDMVYGHFLDTQPMSVWEGVVLGYWKVIDKPISSSSWMQLRNAGSCKKEPEYDCPDHTRNWHIHACAKSRSWMKLPPTAVGLLTGTPLERFNKKTAECREALEAHDRANFATWVWPQKKSGSDLAPCKLWHESSGWEKIKEVVQDLDVDTDRGAKIAQITSQQIIYVYHGSFTSAAQASP